MLSYSSAINAYSTNSEIVVPPMSWSDKRFPVPYEWPTVGFSPAQLSGSTDASIEAISLWFQSNELAILVDYYVHITDQNDLLIMFRDPNVALMFSLMFT